MTKQEYLKTEKQFNKLFDLACEVGFSNMTDGQKREYRRLQKILVDYENEQLFYEVIDSGDYRIG